jgi:hypothetical protein
MYSWHPFIDLYQVHKRSEDQHREMGLRKRQGKGLERNEIDTDADHVHGQNGVRNLGKNL